MMGQEHKIREMMARAVYGAMARGGPNYRELRELVDALREAGHGAKGLFDDLLDEGDSD